MLVALGIGSVTSFLFHVIVREGDKNSKDVVLQNFKKIVTEEKPVERQRKMSRLASLTRSTSLVEGKMEHLKAKYRYNSGNVRRMSILNWIMEPQLYLVRSL